MTDRLLALIHGAQPEDRLTVLGSLVPAFTRRGFSIDVCSLPDGDERPVLHDVDFVCVAGSGESVYDDSLAWIETEREVLAEAVDRGIPTLGVCFGAQFLARVLGGSVAPGVVGEYGFTEVRAVEKGLVAPGPKFAFHHDVITLPKGARVVAENDVGVQAFVCGPHLGVQFHPEVTPECFAAWRRRPNGRTADEEGGVDLADLEAQIGEHQVRASHDCDQLVGAFLRHAMR